MCGRGKTPLPSDLLTGNISEAERKQRQEAEINFGPYEWKMPRGLHGKKEAQKKWKKIVKLYKESDLAVVGKADEETLERYCLAYEDYYLLRNARDTITAKHADDPEDMVMALQKTKIDVHLHRVMDQLNKLDMVLLLTPLAKIHTRDVPRRHVKKEDPKVEKAGKFGV